MPNPRVCLNLLQDLGAIFYVKTPISLLRWNLEASNAKRGKANNVAFNVNL